MGSSNNTFDRSDTNCIKISYNCGKEFSQYNAFGNIVYYFKYRINPFKGQTLIVYDMYDKEIGYIERVVNCVQVRYNFYDENKRLKNSIEINKQCCTTTFIYYKEDKSIESTITRKSDCCEITFDEYDKYNSRTNGAIGRKECFGDVITFIENDSNGNPISIIRCFSECCSRKIKFYDNNNMELNLNEKSIINDGFTKIQQIIIITFLFAEKNNDQKSK